MRYNKTLASCLYLNILFSFPAKLAFFLNRELLPLKNKVYTHNNNNNTSPLVYSQSTKASFFAPAIISLFSSSFQKEENTYFYNLYVSNIFLIIFLTVENIFRGK